MSGLLVSALRLELRRSREAAARIPVLAEALALYVDADDPDVRDARAERQAAAVASFPVFQRARKPSGLPEGITKDRSRYRARPYRNGQRVDLGSHESLDKALAAIRAYDARHKNPTRIEAAPDGAGPVETSASQEAAHGAASGEAIQPPHPLPLRQNPTSAQSAGEAGESPEEGSAAQQEPDGAKDVACQAGQCVTKPGPAEGIAVPVDAGPASDDVIDLPPLPRVQRFDPPKQEPAAPGSYKTIPVLGSVNGRHRRIARDNPADAQPKRANGEARLLPAATPSPRRAAEKAAKAAAPAAAIPDGLSLVSVGPLAIDEAANVIVGPRGAWTTHRPCVRSLKRLAAIPPGSCLSAAMLRKAGNWAHDELFTAQIPGWTRELARIGAKLGRLGDSYFLAPLESAADAR